MSGYYAKGRECTGGCGRAVTWTTPRGKDSRWTDEQGRCSTCAQKNRAVDQTIADRYAKQDAALQEWKRTHTS
jgi:hypothetical protein